MLMLKMIAQTVLPIAVMMSIIAAVFVLNLMFWGGIL